MPDSSSMESLTAAIEGLDLYIVLSDPAVVDNMDSRVLFFRDQVLTSTLGDSRRTDASERRRVRGRDGGVSFVSLSILGLDSLGFFPGDTVSMEVVTVSVSFEGDFLGLPRERLVGVSLSFFSTKVSFPVGSGIETASVVSRLSFISASSLIGSRVSTTVDDLDGCLFLGVVLVGVCETRGLCSTVAAGVPEAFIPAGVPCGVPTGVTLENSSSDVLTLVSSEIASSIEGVPGVGAAEPVPWRLERLLGVVTGVSGDSRLFLLPFVGVVLGVPTGVVFADLGVAPDRFLTVFRAASRFTATCLTSSEVAKYFSTWLGVMVFEWLEEGVVSIFFLIERVLERRPSPSVRGVETSDCREYLRCGVEGVIAGDAGEADTVTPMSFKSLISSRTLGTSTLKLFLPFLAGVVEGVIVDGDAATAGSKLCLDLPPLLGVAGVFSPSPTG